ATSLPEAMVVTNDLTKVKITDEHQPKHSGQLFIGGTLLNDIHQLELNKFYAKKHQAWRLIYKATRHGFSASDFHSHCDGKGPTMTIIQSKEGDYLFGGYTAVPWSSKAAFKEDTTAFLFTLTNPHCQPATQFHIDDKQTHRAVTHHSNAGPIFGTRNSITTSTSSSHDSLIKLISNFCHSLFYKTQSGLPGNK
ncbi:unnamed protein product, partial [Didymodactylos carnosus]